MRVAPAAIISCAVFWSRTPPDALTPMRSPTVRRISAMSAAVAPPLLKPVEVFTKSAPARFDASHARTFSASVSRHVSRITFSRAPSLWQVSATAAMSRSTAASAPDFSRPTFITMSISQAPSSIARRAS